MSSTNENTWDVLLAEAKDLYEPGRGPWNKSTGELDQIDLVYLENMADGYSVYSDPRGLLSSCIKLLVAEVRNARDWPTPDRLR